MTINADIDKYKYSGYDILLIGFDRRVRFSFRGSEFGKDVIIFGVDMSSSVHVDNKKKDILILGVGPTQALDGSTLTVEKKYSLNFTENNKNFV